MKKTIVVGILFMLMIGSFILVPNAVAGAPPVNPLTVDLIADGGDTYTDVGDVTIYNDGTTLTITYTTVDSWYISETHLHVANSVDGIPHTKKGNPIPGKFAYKTYNDPMVQEVIYSISWDINEPCYVAAHAVVQHEVACPAIMYGTSLGGSGVGDKIYEIDVTALTAVELFNTGLSPSLANGPNGNAYDEINNRLYYSAYLSPDRLYFYDFINPVNNYAGPIPGQVACAGWYNGEYYYIPQNSGNLYKISFNLDGTILATTLIQTYAGKSFNFGDIVITSNGLMYGSSTVNGIGKFWSIDLMNANLYIEISNMVHMQLAFGSDGNLYGHDAADGKFYTIDYIAGTRTLIGTIGTLLFTDLASGPYDPCAPQIETAWGEGDRFVNTEWAMYIVFSPGTMSKTTINRISNYIQNLLVQLLMRIRNILQYI